LKQNFIKIILTKDQKKSKGDKEGVRIRNSGCVKSDGTHCCTEKFNVSKGFSKTAVRGSAIKVL